MLIHAINTCNVHVLTHPLGFNSLLLYILSVLYMHKTFHLFLQLRKNSDVFQRKYLVWERMRAFDII